MDGAPVQAEPGPAGLRVGEVVGERGLGAGLDPTSQLSTRGRWRLLRSCSPAFRLRLPHHGGGAWAALDRSHMGGQAPSHGARGGRERGQCPFFPRTRWEEPGDRVWVRLPAQPLTSLVSLGAFLIPSEALVFSPVTEHPPDRGEVPQTGT